MCSIFQCFETNPKKPHDLVEASVSFSFSAEMKSFSVRLVHPEGKEELFHYAISVSRVMQKYPGMCIATPEVFKLKLRRFDKKGQGSVSFLAESRNELSPGNKYYLIPKTTVRKLKLKWLNKKKEKRLRRVDEETNSKSAGISDTSGDISMDSVGSANFYYKRCDCEKESVMKKKKKQFVPPIHKPRTRKGFEWEPDNHQISRCLIFILVYCTLPSSNVSRLLNFSVVVCSSRVLIVAKVCDLSSRNGL